MKSKKSFWIGLGTGISISLLVGALYFGVQSLLDLTKSAGLGLIESEYKSQDEKFEDILEKLNMYYHEDIDPDIMFKEAYKGFVDGVGDPYTVYFSKDEFKSFTEDIDGTYEGIGAYVGFGETKEELLIIAPMVGSPSEKAGLKAMDRFISVDGVDVSGMTTEELVKLIKGEKGTTVVIKVRRNDEVLEYSVVRDEIVVPTVSHEMLENKIGYLRIGGFDRVTEAQFMEAFLELEAQNQEGMIIDLRYNGGGLTHVVAAIADELLPKGVIYYTEDKEGNKATVYSDEERQFKKPLVVLVNQSSASASEILAGAIKDHERGVIVGTTTFGKGLVQQPVILSDGSVLKVTVAKYFTADGHYIQGVGIEPDVVAEIPELEENARVPDDWDPQLDVAIDTIMDMIKE
ncbi:S41 family peptidase [Petrocella sp. FN5]|uniref:S41 family peptidase n=1 Tax=Petrocella sp. FN5 TaxID=3032002 RepID=UPI0023DA459B|nr:S41 family peptidase [Petrocella sp. FN5]MDF1615961.1 S41 family peptidase [Petrocella sp. FN5]